MHPASLLHPLANLRRAALALGLHGIFLLIGPEDNERCSTGIKHIFRKQHRLCERIEVIQTQPNLLEHVRFICCDTRHRSLLSARALGYSLCYERSENGIEPNLRKKCWNNGSRTCWAVSFMIKAEWAVGSFVTCMDLKSIPPKRDIFHLASMKSNRSKDWNKTIL